MIKDRYLVGRSERSEVRHVGVHLVHNVGLRSAHSDLQIIMKIYHLEMVLFVGIQTFNMCYHRFGDAFQTISTFQC